ncbi:carbohydrate porin [Aquirhabdus sp.]|uniref:carbohydrate porin n=1 Tax=Aquirhabdus sp. TaxID=2824160 RepID=UPI00396CE03E
MKSSFTLLATIVGLLTATAHAQDIKLADDIQTRPYLLGDWGGYRSHLAEEGVQFNLGYTSEVAHNFSGGKQHDTRYTDQFALGTTLDLNRLLGWNGGTFQLTYSHRNGRNLSGDADLGTLQQVQEVYGRGQTWRLTQFWLNQDFMDGLVQWKIGRVTVGEDFANFSCDFQNLTFCGSQPGNIVGSYWLNWPVSQWGSRLKVKTTPDTYIQLGVYQVNPTYASDDYAVKDGWKLDNPDGTKGALIPLEFGWLPKVNQLSGSYKLGFWYNNAGGPDLYLNQADQPLGLNGGDTLQRDSRSGAYINFSQQVTGKSENEGATIFLNATAADRETSANDHQIALGLEYKAPFNRVDDMVGAALGATHINGRQTAYQQEYNTTHLNTGADVGRGYEYATEFFYSWAPLHSVAFRPNLQYVINPGGIADNKNVFVLGLKTIITL